MLLGLTEPTDGEARVVGLDPTRAPARGQAAGRLPARQRRLLRRPDRPREPALHGAPQPPPRQARPSATIDEVLDQVGLTRPRRRPDRHVLAGHAPAPRHRRRAGQGPRRPHPRRADDRDRPARRRRDPRPAAARSSTTAGLAILLSSHLLNQVQSVCDRIGIFAAGRLIGQGTLPELASAFGEAGAQIEVAFGFDDPAAASTAEGVVGGIDGVTTVRREADLEAPWHVLVADRERDAEVRNAIIGARSSTDCR